MRIYIAGKLSSKEKNDRTPSQVVVDYIQNVNRMCKIASEVRKLGHYPFVPALDFLLGAINGGWDEEMYRGIGMEFLKVCDAILVISWSWGVEQEVKLAKELGLRIFTSVDVIPNERNI